MYKHPSNIKISLICPQIEQLKLLILSDLCLADFEIQTSFLSMTPLGVGSHEFLVSLMYHTDATYQISLGLSKLLSEMLTDERRRGSPTQRKMSLEWLGWSKYMLIEAKPIRSDQRYRNVSCMCPKNLIFWFEHV